MLARVPLEIDSFLWSQWKCCRLAFITAPLGFGKSEFARRMLAGSDVLAVDAERDDVLAAVTDSTAAHHDAVLIDNIHDALAAEDGAALAAVAAHADSTRFVFLSRAPMPGWLTAFFAAGDLLIVTADDLLFTDSDIAHLLAANGIHPAPDLVERLAHVTRRYPLALSLALAHIADGADCAWEDDLYDEVMLYFEAEFGRRFDAEMQKMLLAISLLDYIDDGLIQAVLGKDEGARLADALQHMASFAMREGKGWRFRPVVAEFFGWERPRRLDRAEIAAAAEHAISYLELRGSYAEALELCSRSGDTDRMLSLLEGHARLSPGAGSYYELERYYHGLPDETIRESARLMRIMSLLDSMGMDILGSERWYAELEDYAGASVRTTEERLEAESYLRYLDIALPHRHLESLVDAVSALKDLDAGNRDDLALSITSGLPSILNGGRDLSPWVPEDDEVSSELSRLAAGALGKYATGCIEIALCESKFEKGEDVTAYAARVNALLPKIRRDGELSIEFAGTGIICRSLTDQGKARQALALLDSLRRRLAPGETPEKRRILKNLEAMRCRCWLRLGERERVHVWLEEHAPDVTQRLFYMDRAIYLTVCQAYLAEARYQEAQMLMAALGEFLLVAGRIIDTINFDILAAICAWRGGGGSWEKWLSRALVHASRYGYVRPITQYGAEVVPILLEARQAPSFRQAERGQLERLIRGARMQASFYPSYLASPATIQEPLTEKELQVLRLICQDRSNAEIGALLGIKLPTVKTHVSHILAKLDVERRSQAATEARRLRLI